MTWFKNSLYFRLADNADLDQLQAALATRPFAAPAPSAPASIGWVPPAEHAPDLLAYPIAGSYLVAMRREDKVVTSDAIKAATAKRISEIEEREHRKVGRKEQKQIKQTVTEELLPQALSRIRTTRALIDPTSGWIWVDTSNHNRAEDLVKFIHHLLPSFATRRVQTQKIPQLTMTGWLQHGILNGFSLDDECKLQAPGEAGATVSCRRLDIGAESVRRHINDGMLATQIAVTWADRISLIITDALQLKRLKMLDLLQDQLREADAQSADALFDATMTLQLAELRELTAAVIESMGGLEDNENG